MFVKLKKRSQEKTRAQPCRNSQTHPTGKELPEETSIKNNNQLGGNRRLFFFEKKKNRNKGGVTSPKGAENYKNAGPGGVMPQEGKKKEKNWPGKDLICTHGRGKKLKHQKKGEKRKMGGKKKLCPFEEKNAHGKKQELHSMIKAGNSS